jgi:DNA-binding NarL/FixJ family response regulator
MQTSAAAKPTVMLTVDDHPLIRSALREVVALMAERIELIEASNPEDGLALLRRRPDTDIVFLDLSFAQHDGLAFVERYRAAAPATPVVIYTMHEDLATLRQALAHGAAGIVPKTHSAKVLQQAIEVVMDGGVYLPPELARRLAAHEAPPSPGALAAAMSAQQWKILELLAQGLPNKAIARELGIAASTVKNQLTVVFGKLGVSNRTQAAIAARALLKSKPPGV